MVNLIEKAIPVFFLLILLEVVLSQLIHRRVYHYSDSINDLSMGIVDQVGGAFLKSIVFTGYLYLYDNYRLFDISAFSPTTAMALARRVRVHSSKAGPRPTL